MTVFLGAAPVCTSASSELDARLGAGWRGLLEKRLGRPIDSSEGCVGDRLELSPCAGQGAAEAPTKPSAICVRYTSSTKERRIELPDHDAPDALALMVTGLIADPSVSRPAGDLTPLPPLIALQPDASPAPPRPAPPTVVAPAEKPLPFQPLVMLGGGIGFQKGLVSSATHLGFGLRIDRWSVNLELVQLGLFEGAADLRLWMAGLVLWYGFTLSQRWSLDVGVGLGLVSDGVVWSGATSTAFGAQTRFLVRPTVALTSWLFALVRFEFGLSTALNGRNPPSSHAALQLGLEARF